MEIIRSVTQFDLVFKYFLRVCFLSGEFALVYLNNNYLLSKDRYIGKEYGTYVGRECDAPSVTWKSLGFGRGILYG